MKITLDDIFALAGPEELEGLFEGVAAAKMPLGAAERIKSKVTGAVSAPKKKNIWVRWLAVAAAFAVVLLGGWFALKYAGSVPEPVPHQPTQAQPQPIDFDSYGDVLNFLASGDVSPYARTEEETAAYRSMVDAFLDDGYIYEIGYKGSAEGVERIAVYPEARYEDVGIQGWITVNGEMYQFVVYTVRGKVQISSGETALSDYLTHGIGLNIKSDTIVINGVPYVSTTVGSGGKNDTRRNVLYRAIDETHYLAVRSTAPTETITGVLGSITIEKQAIESPPAKTD